MAFTREQGLRAMRAGHERYCALDDDTWAELAALCDLVELPRDGFFCRAGEVPRTFGYVCRGLLRGYALDAEGREYNKVFFPEDSFPGAMVALHTGAPSALAIQALEPTALMRIDFAGYRRLLERRSDLKWFQILYLERNWLLAKEPRELALVQEDATQRYQRFRREQPGLEERMAQYHVASHLGITPTQLSRIRRALGLGGGKSGTST